MPCFEFTDVVPDGFGGFTSAQMDAMIADGATWLGGFFLTDAECVANCPALTGTPVKVTVDSTPMCLTDTVLTIQGSGFVSPVTDNTITLYDALGTQISHTVTGGSPTSLNVTLLSPIAVVGNVSAVVVNSNGTSGPSLAVVAQAVDCSFTSGCLCDPIPNTVYLIPFQADSFGGVGSPCPCAIGDYGTLVSSGGAWTDYTLDICGVRWAATIGCVLVPGFTNTFKYQMRMTSNTTPAHNFIFDLDIIQCGSPLIIIGFVDVSGVPGMCVGTLAFFITDSLLLGSCYPLPDTMTITASEISGCPITDSAIITKTGLETWSVNMTLGGVAATVVVTRVWYNSLIGVRYIISVTTVSGYASSGAVVDSCVPVSMHATLDGTRAGVCAGLFTLTLTP